MPSLGELGKPKIREVDTFTWFGPCSAACASDTAPDGFAHTWTAGCAEIRIGDVSDLLLIDFLMRAQTIDEKDMVAAANATQEMFRQIVAETDFERWWSTALRNRQGVEDLLYLLNTLVEGVTGYPTQRRPDSSPGRRGTGRKSRGGSSSPGMSVVRRLERQGRGDLALGVLEHQRSTA